MNSGANCNWKQSTWSNPARVDTLARSQLGLMPPPQERIRVETARLETRMAVP